MVFILANFLLSVLALWYIRNLESKRAEAAYKKGLSVGKLEAKADYDRTRQIIKQSRLDGFLHPGAMVISVPNEWSDLVVGKIQGFLECASGVTEVPWVLDIISGEERAGGLTVPFDVRLLEALLKLDPFERYSLLIASNAHTSQEYIFDKQKEYPGSETHVPARSNEEIRKILQREKVL